MIKLNTLLIAIMFVIAPVTQATITSCSTDDVTISTLCIGQLDGNDSELVINDIAPSGAFGHDDWELLQRNNIGSSDPSIATAPHLDISITGSGATWGIDLTSLFDDITDAIFAAKGGNNYALYLLDLDASCTNTGVCAGTWSTDALTNGGGEQPALSHASFYVRSGDTPPETSVSEPPVGLLLGASLLALGTIRKFKKS